jgi:hypothetical protein
VSSVVVVLGTTFLLYPHSFGPNEIVLCVLIASSLFYGVLVLIVKSQESFVAARNKIFHSSGYFIFCSLIHGFYLACFPPRNKDTVVPTTDFLFSICFPIVFALTYFSSSSGNHDMIVFVLLTISLLSLVLCSLRMNPHLNIWPTTSICIMLDIFLIVQTNHFKKSFFHKQNIIVPEEIVTQMNLEEGPRKTVKGTVTNPTNSTADEDSKYMIQIMANIAHDLKTVRSLFFLSSLLLSLICLILFFDSRCRPLW